MALNHNEPHRDSHDQDSSLQAGCPQHIPRTRHERNLCGLEARIVIRRNGRVQASIPAVFLEARRTRSWHFGAGPREAAAENGTAHAGRPLAVHGSIALCGDIVAVLDDRIALRVVVCGIKGGDVRVDDVWRVWDVDNERRYRGCVRRVAAEEGWTLVESQVYHRVHVWNGRE